MSMAFRILLIGVSLLSVITVIKQIRNAKMQIGDTIFWVVLCILTLLLSIFPQIAIWATDMLSIISPANFVFLCFIFMLMVKLFRVSVRLSQLDHQVKTLTQELALKEFEDDKMAQQAEENTIQC